MNFPQRFTLKNACIALRSLSIIALVFSLFSCKFYYNVADVQKQLNETNSDARSSCTKLNGQINALVLQYESMRCDTGNVIFFTANQQMLELKRGQKNLEQHSESIEKEYYNFLTYTKDLSKIESGTTTWKNFKVTKKLIKENAKQIQKKAKSTIDAAKIFHTYVEEKIVPVVKFCDVGASLNEFELSLKNLGENQKKYLQQVKQFEKDVNAFLDKNAYKNPEKCQIIKEDLRKMSAKGAEMTKLKSSLLQHISYFRKTTSGTDKIFSCSKEWVAVTKMQEEFIRLNKEILEIESSVESLNLLINKEIEALKQN